MTWVSGRPVQAGAAAGRPDLPPARTANLENYGVAPDVWVENSPQDELAGFDRELKEAVDEALRMLASGEWQYGGSGRPIR